MKFAKDTLSRGQNLILFSPRRYGKTSLIKKTLEQLGKQNIEVFYFDLYKIATIDRFYSYYANAVMPRIKSPVAKMLGQLKAFIPSLNPKIEFSDPDVPNVKLNLELSNITNPQTCHELLSLIENYAKKKKKKACVVFDEFQEIVNMEEGDLLEKEMRSAFQHHTHVTYAFLGSKHHLMNELFKDKNRPFYNFGSHFELNPIENQEWNLFFKKMFKKGGYKITDELSESIVSYTRGHPHYTQMLASELWALYEEDNQLSTDCITQILASVLQKEQYAYEQIWDMLNARQRVVLEAVARENVAEVYSKDFIQKYHLGTPATIQRAVQKMIKMDILTKKRDKFIIVDPIFSYWLVQGYE
ncbi:MAG: AAA family ATPase [Fibrobacteria bacterium]|nr:AAA family ATPase [Fibrobacteria bacterium]